MNPAPDSNAPEFQFDAENESDYYIQPHGFLDRFDHGRLPDSFCPDQFGLISHLPEDSDRNEEYPSSPPAICEETQQWAEASALRGSSSSSLFLGRKRNGRLRRKPAKASKTIKVAKKKGKETKVSVFEEGFCNNNAQLFLESYIYSDTQKLYSVMPLLQLTDNDITLIKIFFREKLFKFSKINKQELKELFSETDESRFKELALKFHGSMGHQKMGNILRALFPKIVTYIMKLSSLDHVPLPDHDEFNGITYSSILDKFGLTEKFLLCLNTQELKDYLNKISREIFHSNCRAWITKLSHNPKADIRMGVIPSDCEAALRVFAFQVRGKES